MKSTRLQLSGISARRLILLPEEQRDDRAHIGRRDARPRVRRYRLGVLSGQVPASARAQRAEAGPRSLAPVLHG